MLLTTALSKQQIIPTEMQRPLARVEVSRREQAHPAETSQGGKEGVTPERRPSTGIPAALGNDDSSSNLRAKSVIQQASPNLSLNVSSLSMVSFSRTTRTQL